MYIKKIRTQEINTKLAKKQWLVVNDKYTYSLIEMADSYKPNIKTRFELVNMSIYDKDCKPIFTYFNTLNEAKQWLEQNIEYDGGIKNETFIKKSKDTTKLPN